MTESKAEGCAAVIFIMAIAAFFGFGFLVMVADITGPEYSTGWRSGQLQKFNKRGVIFQTYEGELALAGIKTRGAGDTARVSSTFEFSVTDEAIAEKLAKAVEEGEQHVTLRYRQYWWSGRCSTDYRIEEVKFGHHDTPRR